MGRKEGGGRRRREGDGGVRKRRRTGGSENPLCVQPACPSGTASHFLSLCLPPSLPSFSSPPPPLTAPVLPADETEMMDDVACSALKDDGVQPTKTRSSLPATSPTPPPPRQNEKWDARDADREQQGGDLSEKPRPSGFLNAMHLYKDLKCQSEDSRASPHCSCRTRKGTKKRTRIKKHTEIK